MKYIKEDIIIVLVIAITIYLLGAFISMEINPKHWHESGRLISAIFLVAASATIISALYMERE